MTPDVITFLKDAAMMLMGFFFGFIGGFLLADVLASGRCADCKFQHLIDDLDQDNP